MGESGDYSDGDKDARTVVQKTKQKKVLFPVHPVTYTHSHLLS